MDRIETQIRATMKKARIGKNKKIVVALSGGKDSTATAHFLNKLGYKNLWGFHIDLGLGTYSARCLDAVKKLCVESDLKLKIYDVKKEMGSSMCYIRSAVQSRKAGAGLKNCAVCGVLKKWIMNREARKMRADFIATGHNADDEAQTVLLNIFKGSPELSFNSGIVSKNVFSKKFVPRIKPLFYVAENDVREFAKKQKLPVVFEKCPCGIDSYRISIRKFLNTVPEKSKLNILKNFEKILDKKKTTASRINTCEICGEPSRGKVCKRCGLMN